MAPLPDTDATARWAINFWVRDADEAAALGGAVVAALTDRPPFRGLSWATPAGPAVAVASC